MTSSLVNGPRLPIINGLNDTHLTATNIYFTKRKTIRKPTGSRIIGYNCYCMPHILAGCMTQISGEYYNHYCFTEEVSRLAIFSLSNRGALNEWNSLYTANTRTHRLMSAQLTYCRQNRIKD